jgi:hypothetical protein
MKAKFVYEAIKHLTPRSQEEIQYWWEEDNKNKLYLENLLKQYEDGEISMNELSDESYEKGFSLIQSIHTSKGLIAKFRNMNTNNIIIIELKR